MRLGVDPAKDGVAHFGNRHPLDGSRGGKAVSASAEAFAYFAHIHSVDPAASHKLHLVVHISQGEKNVARLHFHEFLGKISKIADECFGCRFGYDDMVCSRLMHRCGINERMENLDMGACHVMPDEIRNDRKLHPPLFEPGGGPKIFRRCGCISERACIRVHAKPEQRRHFALHGNVLSRKGATDQRTCRSNRGDMLEGGGNGVARFRFRVMVPYMDFHARNTQNVFNMRQPRTLAGIRNHEKPNAVRIDFSGRFEAEKRFDCLCKKTEQCFFHASGKNQTGVGIQKRKAEHG